MHIDRLVEETKEKAGISLENEDVYMASTFNEFVQVREKRRKESELCQKK